MLIYFCCLCPLGRAIKLNLNISKEAYRDIIPHKLNFDKQPISKHAYIYMLIRNLWLTCFQNTFLPVMISIKHSTVTYWLP